MNHTIRKTFLFVFLLLNFSLFIFSSSGFQYEIVPFDYADDDMREQICDMVDNDADIQNMTHETAASMRQQLLTPDLKHKNNWFVCRATDGSGIIYGYMQYVMSPQAYLIGSSEKSLLFNSTYLDEYENDEIESVVDFVNFGFLDNFAVRKEYRGQGFAQAMLQYFEDDCRRHGCQSIVLGVEFENHKARRSYRKFGFEVHPVYPIAMIKKLD